MNRITPAELVYPFHIEMIHHGRALCRPTNPRCIECPVRGECHYYAQNVAPRRGEKGTPPARKPRRRKPE
jgi:endonuclease III